MRRIIHHVKKIRQQPEEVRRHILHLVTLAGGVILLILWIYTLGADTNVIDSSEEVNAENDMKPFAVLKDNMVGGYESISETGE